MSVSRLNEFRKQVHKRGRPPSPASRSLEEFTKLSSTLSSQLQHMYTFLLRIRPRYIQSIHFEPTLTTRYHPANSLDPNDVTPKEREAFDDTIIAFLRRAKGQLLEMKQVATRDEAQNKKHQHHRKQVALDLEARLQEIATEYDQMVKWAASETMRVSLTLDMGFSATNEDASALRKRKTRNRWPGSIQFGSKNIETTGAAAVIKLEQNDPSAAKNRQEQQQQPEEKDNSKIHSSIEKEDKNKTTTDLSENLLRQESAMLERSLNTRLDATQQLETQFIELANMTKMFTTHIEEQHDQVQTINEDTNDALDYANSGLKELNKASTGTSKYFLMVVFLLLSFIILFLDWWSY